jgi:hypothetical protein
MLRCPAGVFDEPEPAINLLCGLFVSTIRDGDCVQAGRLLLDLSADVGDVLRHLIVYETRPLAARIVLALPLYVFVPLPGVRRVAELRILFDLAALIPQGIH